MLHIGQAKPQPHAEPSVTTRWTTLLPARPKHQWQHGSIAANNSSVTTTDSNSVTLSGSALNGAKGVNVVSASGSSVANGVNVYDGSLTTDHNNSGATVNQANSVDQSQTTGAMLTGYKRGQNSQYDDTTSSNVTKSSTSPSSLNGSLNHSATDSTASYTESNARYAQLDLQRDGHQQRCSECAAPARALPTTDMSSASNSANKSNATTNSSTANSAQQASNVKSASAIKAPLQARAAPATARANSARPTTRSANTANTANAASNVTSCQHRRKTANATKQRRPARARQRRGTTGRAQPRTMDRPARRRPINASNATANQTAAANKGTAANNASTSNSASANNIKQQQRRTDATNAANSADQSAATNTASSNVELVFEQREDCQFDDRTRPLPMRRRMRRRRAPTRRRRTHRRPTAPATAARTRRQLRRRITASRRRPTTSQPARPLRWRRRTSTPATAATRFTTSHVINNVQGAVSFDSATGAEHRRGRFDPVLQPTTPASTCQVPPSRTPRRSTWSTRLAAWWRMASTSPARPT